MYIENKNHNQEMIDNLKHAAESLITNAESIIGTEKYLGPINISIDLNWREVPAITVSKEFAPEGFVESLI